MTRLGIQKENLDRCIDLLKGSNYVYVEGLWSHLATADENDNTFLNEQISRFKKYCKKVRDVIDSIKFIHIEPSGALLRYDNNFFNMVRPGISLYGAAPFGNPVDDLKPVMEFRAPIVLIKNITSSTHVGYNRTFIASKEMKIGLVQGGYADGVSTSFSNKGRVGFNHQTAPIIGSVAFDLTTIDISELECREFDYVTFWGGSNADLRIETIARMCGRNPYELFTGISKRVKRLYIND